MDDRYDTVIRYMREALPRSFRDLVFEQLGGDRVYASFVEHSPSRIIQASGVSDGHIQILALLTSLFAESRDRYALLLVDEPEMSLHPHAIVVFAKAAKEAAANWNRQIFLATHSPVLISQFPPENTLAVEADAQRASVFLRLSEASGIQDLLQQYAAGSLYMAEAVAKQSAEPAEESGADAAGDMSSCAAVGRLSLVDRDRLGH